MNLLSFLLPTSFLIPVIIKIMGAKDMLVCLPTLNSAKIIKWKVGEGTIVYEGRVILLYDISLSNGCTEQKKLKATEVGTVRKLLVKEGEVVDPGGPLLELERGCSHPTVMNDLCAECGADLREQELKSSQASIPMLHSVPELKVSEEQAKIIGEADQERLLQDRKLVLLVDLDQTIIHTTNDNIPNNFKDVYHFQLGGPNSQWYHTRLRPGTHQFLSTISEYYELHICTFGARNYAHMIAHFLDPDGKYFSHRILSRDECFNPNSKMANLKALFPCGDRLVCIIDDREDVWNFAPNLIHVKPYHFFQHTGDIHAPPGLMKNENDDKEGYSFNQYAQGTNMKKLNIGETVSPRGKKRDDSSESELEEGELRGQINSDSLKESDDISTTIHENQMKSLEISVIENENKSYQMEDKNTANKFVNNINIGSKQMAVDKPIKNNTEQTKENDETNHNNILEQSRDQNKEETFSCVKEHKEIIKVIETEQLLEKRGNVKKPEDLNLKEKTIAESSKLIEIEEMDDYLMYLEEILKKIHRHFYDLYDQKEGLADLKQVIPAVKGKTLAGKKLVFSGLVPRHMSLEKSKPYNIACSLGATVSPDLEKDMTHLVAMRAGTAKVNAARKMKNVKMVTPDWLWICAERWEHVNELLFPIRYERSGTRHPPPHCTSPPPTPNNLIPAPRARTLSGRFMDTINPLMSFSSKDIEDMDAEVEDIFNESESEGEGKSKKRKRLIPLVEESSSSSADSLAAENVKGWGKKRTRKEINSDDEERNEDDTESINSRFRRGAGLPSDIEFGEGSDGGLDNSLGSDEPPDEISDQEWNMMGQTLEREFLEGD
uniref:RNA polymerase II subunit A C-terminal domain phosphatase n=2 Tax=Clastoptera arizonana TaxID=38151 RepID=A0A1B6DUE4_9HEMI